MSKERPNREGLLRVAGLLLFVAAGTATRTTLGTTLGDGDPLPDGPLATVAVAGRWVLGGAGLALFLLARRWSARPWVAPVFLVSAAAAALGLWSSALWYELVPPRQTSDLARLHELMQEVPYVAMGTAEIDGLERKLGQVEGPSAATVDLLREIAALRLRRGEFEVAVAHLERAHAQALELGLPAESVAEVDFRLGLAHLRWGESSHCLQMCNRESCLLPIEAAGIWPDGQPAERALAHFAACLERAPDHLRARWLSNIAHMVAGRDPARLPASVKARPEFFDASAQAPRFRNIAAELGVDTFDLCGGAIVDDFDGDGFLDLMSSTYEPQKSLTLHRNNGDGTFRDVTAESGLADQLGGFNLAHADFDNDGLLDVFVLRGAWMKGRFGRIRNSLLRQGPDHRFTDVTEAAGLGGRAYPSLACGWSDYDLDGHVDLYVANEELGGGKYAPSQLFRNGGDGTFTDVAREAGVRNSQHGKGVTWGDVDNDGDPDLFVANYNGPNRLYRNDGGGTFTDIAPALGVDTHGRHGLSFTSWFWDVNNDGWLDLFVAGYAVPFEDAVSTFLDLPAESADRLKLYLGDGRGGLRDASRRMQLDVAHSVMGANFGDIDNDGFLDMYLGTGAPPLEYLVPNMMWRNVGGERFQDVTAAARVGHLQKGHGIAFGDLDNDGDQDLFAQLGGFVQDDRFYNALFENPGNANSWITLQLAGTRSNRAAIGARVRVVATTPAGPRTLHRVVTSGGSFGASSLQLELGLGNATDVERVEVDWPTIDSRQVFTDFEPRSFYRLTEGESAPERLERSRLTLDS